MSDNNEAAMNVATTSQGQAPVESIATQQVQPESHKEPSIWSDDFTDKELKGWVELKGFHKQSPEVMAKSYRSLEKLLGADKAGRTVVLPANAEDKDGYNNLYSKLGRPEKADDYKLDGTGNEEFTKWAKSAFFEAGMSAKNAENFTKSYNDFISKEMEKAKASKDLSYANEVKEVEREYGLALEQAKHKVNAVATHLGVTEKQVGALGEVLGPKAAMEFFLNIAKNIGEDTFVDNSKDSMLSPDAANAKMNELVTDPEFYKAWVDRNHPSHALNVKIIEDLQNMVKAGRR